MAVGHGDAVDLSALAVLRAGLRLRRDALALIALRLLSLLLLAAPVLLATRSRIAQTVGRMPHAVDQAASLPLSLAALLLREAAEVATPLWLMAAPCFVVVDWVLTAVAAESLAGARHNANEDPSDGQAAPPSPLGRRLLRGRRHLGVYLRLSLVSALGLGLGLLGLRALYRPLESYATHAELSVVTELVVLPLLAALAAALWGGLMGGLGLSCRVLCAAEDRRRALRSVLEVARLWLRSPGLPLLLVVAALLLELSGGALLVWLYPPGAALWPFLAWLAYLVAHAYLWHARVAWVALVYADPRHDDIRARGDTPLRVPRRAAMVRS